MLHLEGFHPKAKDNGARFLTSKMKQQCLYAMFSEMNSQLTWFILLMTASENKFLKIAEIKLKRPRKNSSEIILLPPFNSTEPSSPKSICLARTRRLISCNMSYTSQRTKTYFIRSNFLQPFCAIMRIFMLIRECQFKFKTTTTNLSLIVLACILIKTLTQWSMLMDSGFLQRSIHQFKTMLGGRFRFTTRIPSSKKTCQMEAAVLLEALLEVWLEN